VGRGAWGVGRGAGGVGRGAWGVGRGAWGVGRGSWVLGRGSWVVGGMPLTLCGLCLHMILKWRGCTTSLSCSSPITHATHPRTVQPDAMGDKVVGNNPLQLATAKAKQATKVAVTR
jgi:hypothetical protein